MSSATNDDVLTKQIWNALAHLTKDTEILASISDLYIGLDDINEITEVTSSALVILQACLPDVSQIRLEEALDQVEQKVQVAIEGVEEPDVEIDNLEKHEQDGSCRLCGANQKITIHHTIPKLVLKRMKHGKFLWQGQKRVDVSQFLIAVCRPCHDQIHKLWPHSTLARDLMTVDLLESAPEIQPYLAYKRKREGTLVYE